MNVKVQVLYTANEVLSQFQTLLHQNSNSSYSVPASLLGGFDLEFWAGRRIVVEVSLSHFK